MWKPDTSVQDAYSDELVALLSDLGAVRQGAGVLVGGLEVYAECPYTGGDRVITAVIVRSGYSRHASKNRFRKVQDKAHIVKQIRKMVAEKAENDACVQKYLAQQAEYDARMAVSSATVTAAIADLGQVEWPNTQPRWAHLKKMNVYENQGIPVFGFELSGLTEAQALAIIKIVKG